MGNGTRAFAVAAEQPEKDNPLRTAEMTLEDDYGMIDGVINNGRRARSWRRPRSTRSGRSRKKSPPSGNGWRRQSRSARSSRPGLPRRRSPRSWGSDEPGREVAAGMGLLPGGERQAAVQPALQGLRPSLQAELPGGGVGLPALPVPAREKKAWIRVGNGQNSPPWRRFQTPPL